MLPPRIVEHAPASSAGEQAELDQVGLDHVFDRVARLGPRLVREVDLSGEWAYAPDPEEQGEALGFASVSTPTGPPL